MKGQLAAYKSIRKPLPPPTKIERPLKGRGYRRKGRYGKTYAEKN